MRFEPYVVDTRTPSQHVVRHRMEAWEITSFTDRKGADALCERMNGVCTAIAHVSYNAGFRKCKQEVEGITDEALDALLKGSATRVDPTTEKGESDAARPPSGQREFAERTEKYRKKLERGGGFS